MELLKAALARFRTWESATVHRSAEWETEYPDWGGLYAAAGTALASSSLSPGTVADLVETLARDNEAEFVLGLLEEFPDNGSVVALAAATSPDAEARWQAAVFLGTRNDAASLVQLRALVLDEDEYVRRRALLASVPRDPKFAEDVAASWLTAPHEYARMVALTVLAEVGSVGLHDALERLRSDASALVRGRVAELEEGSRGSL